MSIELSVMDLFCGCGGLSEGLSQANLNVRWANEHIGTRTHLWVSTICGARPGVHKGARIY